MARSTTSTAPASLATGERVERAALQLFFEKGFAGTGIRDIAASAGLGLASMFHYFPNKLAILESLLTDIVDDLQQKMDATLDGVSDPVEQLSRAVQLLVYQHCENRVESFVAQSELRSLEGEKKDEIRAKRATIQRRFIQIVEAGVAEGAFTTVSPKRAALAIVTMCTSVATWYEPAGELKPHDVAEEYVQFALDLLNTHTST